MPGYSIRKVGSLPRLPLKGNLDLTYRCNFNCRHCWLRIPPGAPEKGAELSLEEIRAIVDEARSMGCREWAISGGEPFLRPDFPELFDYITSKAVSYSLNTNGSLITPKIARLLRRRGVKMVALYGATADVQDHATRTSGSFELTMRGLVYLKEAGASFIVQLIPMRDNYHQWEEMVALAGSLSPNWRVGAPWLYMSSSGNPLRNAEIESQRLSPRKVIALDRPDPGSEERMGEICSCISSLDNNIQKRPDDRLFASCIDRRRDFHVDPYGCVTFCSFIKDPVMRYDLRRGTFREAWEKFIPSLADRVRGGQEYQTNCAACDLRADCRWCTAYAYLETGRYGAPIPYLCATAAEARKFKIEWEKNHRRHFQVAGITVRVETDLDLDAVAFKPELERFAVKGPCDDNVTFRHFFEMPKIDGKDLGKELYHKPPWAIFRKNGAWYYLGISPMPNDPELHRIAVFDSEHTHATIYSPSRDEDRVCKMGFHSLSLFPTDQVWLAPLLAERHAVLLHSAAAILNGQGLIFVGHSDAGKSTTVMMLKRLHDSPEHPGNSVEILCDDRNILRRWDTGWRVHGTWSHGDVSDVSPAWAPLRAVLFLEQSQGNEISPLTDRKDIWRRLLATLIKPLATAAWWQKELDVMESLVSEAPCYMMRFDKSGEIVSKLLQLTSGLS